MRKISKIPFKVLDAPELQDDFYLNLVDWSSLNVLSVGLGTCVYLWSACTSQVCVCVCVLRVCFLAGNNILNLVTFIMQFFYYYKITISQKKSIKPISIHILLL